MWDVSSQNPSTMCIIWHWNLCAGRDVERSWNCPCWFCHLLRKVLHKVEITHNCRRGFPYIWCVGKYRKYILIVLVLQVGILFFLNDLLVIIYKISMYKIKKIGWNSTLLELCQTRKKKERKKKQNWKFLSPSFQGVVMGKFGFCSPHSPTQVSSQCD